MIRSLMFALLLVPTLAWADEDPRFTKLRAKAEPVTALSQFLESYVGACEGAFVDPKCREKSEAFRKKYTDKRLILTVEGKDASMLAPGPFSPATKEYAISISPIFPGRTFYWLSHGAPERLDERNDPIVKLLRVTGTLPADRSAMDFAKLFSSSDLRAEVIFAPQSAWSLPRKRGGGQVRGVAARIEGIRVTEASTGRQLGMWLDGQDANAKK